MSTTVILFRSPIRSPLFSEIVWLSLSTTTCGKLKAV
jgi:hypothetical protein